MSPAASHRLIRLADLPAQPWRNGAGVTRELLTLPLVGLAGTTPTTPTTGTTGTPGPTGTASTAGSVVKGAKIAAPPPADTLPWQLRLSVAEVDADGPFSTFAGVTRWFAVLGGAGVVLDIAGTRHPVQTGDAPLRFDGAAATHCRLIDGPTRDLNLMLRLPADGASAPGAGLFVARAGSTWQAPQGGACGLYCVQGARCEAAGQCIDVAAQTLLWFDQAPAAPLRVDAVAGLALTACWISAGAGVAS